MHHDHPKDPVASEPHADAPSGFVAWAATAAEHWKASLAVALLAGAAMAAADNPLRPVTQVSFLASCPADPAGATAATRSTGDLARLLGAEGVADGGRDAAVVAKAERDSDMVSVSFSLHRALGADEARTVAEGLLGRVASALAPQAGMARKALEEHVAIKRGSLEQVTASLAGSPQGGPPTEAVALLLQQQADLRTDIAESTARLAELRDPAIVGDVRVSAARSAFRAWAGPAAAFAIAFLAAPMALRAIAEVRGSRTGARRN